VVFCIFDIINDMNIFSDPQKIISQCSGYIMGKNIADLGAGSGAFTMAAAQLGKSENGKIYAVDVQKDLLDKINADAQNEHLSSVHVVWGNFEETHGTRLKDDSIDTVILANTLFQVENKKDAITEIKRILKKGGVCIVVDWSESFGNIGPKSDHVVIQDTAQKLFTDHNFVISKSIETGEHHYGFIATHN